jgi:hypothetical protein
VLLELQRVTARPLRTGKGAIIGKADFESNANVELPPPRTESDFRAKNHIQESHGFDRSFTLFLPPRTP